MRTKRIDSIEQFIEQEKSVSLDTLCEEFEVSKNTIRRDINELVKKGTIKKVYGGVTVNQTAESQPLLPYQQRHDSFAEEKDAICRLAVEHVNDGDNIYIDTGTTCMNMIDHMADINCTIITNSLHVCWKAVPYPNLKVISLPGILKRETLSFVGSDVTNHLQTFNITKAFMACAGLTVNNGVTNASTEEYLIKKAVIENSRQHYLLTDHSKFDRASLMTYCGLEEIHHIITDMAPGKKYLNFCKEHGITIETCR
ncbi:DeoR/GlpR family DNA-binding transcription regulator [Anaerovorax odorimutans]|uniref:DeoR/GlpR family DNA-binding transcription regulator n=1 Tax=Anaerovorax odorimutans TaxID=109327 RepID=A0ABT1RKJ3_9FIRM|nr:DeoR/GlpR family DNA-binding transcription regulator [Anaerovorax odorimutans]MCQ4635701.1 DeoR/GlpR family DNA-binding transcription regulator [Anaerovorax odorimutans]